MHRSEQRCVNHFTDDTDIDALVNEAKRSPLDKLYDEWLEMKTSTTRMQPHGGELIKRPAMNPGVRLTRLAAGG